jgi:hypothetical protein
MAAPKKQQAKKAAETKELLIRPEWKAVEQKSYEVVANFDAIEAYLNQEAGRYKGVAFSPEQMPAVEAAKKDLRELRTSLTDVLEDVKKKRFNTPKKNFETKMQALISIVTTVEADVDKVLDAENQKRIDELNEALDGYCSKFQKQFGLRPEYEMRIERKKAFYNKTAKESESKADLLAQYEALHKEQTAYDANETLIKDSMSGYPEINEQLLLGRLQRGDESVGELVAWITAEKTRIDVIRAGGDPDAKPEPPKQVGVKNGPITISFVQHIDKVAMTTDVPGMMETKIIEITYPRDVGDALNELFKELKQYGVTKKGYKP